jgi:hypothetical protein
MIVVVGLLVTLVFTLGCATQSPRARTGSVHDIRAHRYDRARKRLRPYAVDRESPDVILDNVRLGVAAIHDGTFFEAKQAMMRAYPYLVTGTVNQRDAEDTTFWGSEGQLVWKGEPFEQAAAWYYQALVPLIEGDWENVRAASQNMLFTLVDFAGAATVDEVMRESESPEWFDDNADEVESDLVLGYLLLGISEYWQGRTTDANVAFDKASELRPDLDELILRLRRGEYNTLLVVEAEPGPTKVLQGRNEEYFTFEPTPEAPPLSLWITDEDGRHLEPIAGRMDAVDFWALAQHPRWWSLRSLRESKSGIGDALNAAGSGAMIYGAVSDDSNVSDKVFFAGLALKLIGMMIASGAQADQRYFDVLPRSVYLVPLELDPGAHTIRLSTPEAPFDSIRHYLMPGYATPAVYVVRLEESHSASEADDSERALGLIRRPVVHPNDVTGPIVGTYPYILGGTCVCTPTEHVLATYQAGGYLVGWELQELIDLYTEERIVFSPLPASGKNNKTYHHILRDGRLMYTPVPGSFGFEQLTFEERLPYEPKSESLKRARERLAAELAPNNEMQ